tara:strand:+ start:291 stop:1037 length:747 start_codon:yes stop_codon:yes gene_type:complete
MIQATYQNDFYAWISTEENRINVSVVKTRIRFLVKFSNDLSGEVFYCYPTIDGGIDIENRYTEMYFTYDATPDRYAGEVNLIPAGYYKYEVYEVSWVNAVPSGGGGIAPEDTYPNWPATEIDVLIPASDDNGIVQGLVDIGKLYLAEDIKRGTEVEYVQSAKRVQTLTIQNSGTGYTTAPTITIEASATGHVATATCTISGGKVDTVTITYAGSGYITNPGVVLFGGGYTTPASITADINEENYIYTS